MYCRHLLVPDEWLRTLVFIQDISEVYFAQGMRGLVIGQCDARLPPDTQPALCLPPVPCVTGRVWVAIQHTGQGLGIEPRMLHLGWTWPRCTLGLPICVFHHQTGSSSRYSWALQLKTAELKTALGMTQETKTLTSICCMNLGAERVIVHQFSYL